MTGASISIPVSIGRDPRLARMARHLSRAEGFRALFVDEQDEDALLPRDRVLKQVCLGALFEVFAWAKEFASPDGDDLKIADCTREIIDGVCELPGFAEAMSAVGWLDDSAAGTIRFRGLSSPPASSPTNTPPPNEPPPPPRQKRRPDRQPAEEEIEAAGATPGAPEPRAKGSSALSGAERMRRYRAKQRAVHRSDIVTSDDATVTTADSDAGSSPVDSSPVDSSQPKSSPASKPSGDVIDEPSQEGPQAAHAAEIDGDDAAFRLDGDAPKRSAADKQAEDILSVFAYYATTYHPQATRNPSPKSKTWKKIRERLDEGFAVERLYRAVDGCHVTPHNCGENESGQKFQSLELIMRDSDHVTRFIENFESHARGSPQFAPKTQRTVAAASSWLSTQRNQTDGNTFPRLDARTATA